MFLLLWFRILGEYHATKPWLWTKAEFDLNFGFRPNSYSFSLGPTLVTQFCASLFFSAIINQEFIVTKLNAFWFPTKLPQFSLNTGHFPVAEPKLSFIIGPESDHWLCLSLTDSLIDWLTHSVTLSKLYWCGPGVWRCQLKTCWGCFCGWCWWWGSCWQQFVADLGAEVWSYS